MNDRTNESGQRPDDQTTVTSPSHLGPQADHGITITIRPAQCTCAIVRHDTPDEARILDRNCVQHREGGGQAVQASCLCGWQSPVVPSRPRAADEGERHTKLAGARTIQLTAEIDRRGIKSRPSHCSCGRPAREVLDGGEHGPTGWCGITGAPPTDPCDCGKGAEMHDRTVCHVYGRGELAQLLMHRAAVDHGANVDFGVTFEEGGMRLRRPAWCADGQQWDEYLEAQRSWWNATVIAAAASIRAER